MSLNDKNLKELENKLKWKNSFLNEIQMKEKRKLEEVIFLFRKKKSVN